MWDSMCPHGVACDEKSMHDCGISLLGWTARQPCAESPFFRIASFVHPLVCEFAFISCASLVPVSAGMTRLWVVSHCYTMLDRLGLQQTFADLGVLRCCACCVPTYNHPFILSCGCVCVMTSGVFVSIARSPLPVASDSTAIAADFCRPYKAARSVFLSWTCCRDGTSAQLVTVAGWAAMEVRSCSQP